MPDLAARLAPAKARVNTSRTVTNARSADQWMWCLRFPSKSCPRSSSRHCCGPSLSMMMTRTDVRPWILSDLHVELTKGWDLPAGDARPDFDVLVVAGDLIPRAVRRVRWLFARAADRPVIYVAGNHEYYGADIDRTIEKARAAAKGTNVHLLQHDSIVTFAGATTWTDFAPFGEPQRAMAVAAERMHDQDRRLCQALPAELRAGAARAGPGVLRSGDEQASSGQAGRDLPSGGNASPQRACPPVFGCCMSG